jgi:protein-S-isoprenylcysteine O-methyltransferase Ste14
VPTSESTFRVVFLAITLLTMAVAAYHRIKASRGGPVSRAGEGIALFAAIRLSGLAMFVCVLLYLLAPQWIVWSQFSAPEVVRWSGAGLGIINVVFLGWTLHTLGKNLTDTTATRKEATLVTSGPYRWVRHPFYVAMLGAVVSLSLLSANWLLGAFGLATFILLLIRAPIEERSLEEKFGEKYRTYRAGTGAVFPRFW